MRINVSRAILNSHFIEFRDTAIRSVKLKIQTLDEALLIWNVNNRQANLFVVISKLKECPEPCQFLCGFKTT